MDYPSKPMSIIVIPLSDVITAIWPKLFSKTLFKLILKVAFINSTIFIHNCLNIIDAIIITSESKISQFDIRIFNNVEVD